MPNGSLDRLIPDLRRLDFAAMEELRQAQGENLLPWKTVNPPPGTFDAFDVAYTGSGTVVAVGAAGKAFISANGGMSWQRLNIPTKKDLYGIHFWSSSVGHIVGDKGLILRTIDGGNTWFDPRAVANYRDDIRNYDCAFIDKDHGVVVGGDGISDDSRMGFIKYTIDGGVTWHSSSLTSFEDSAWNNGLPGVIRAVCFASNGTGIAVGGGWTRGPRYANWGMVPVMLRTTDKGATWTRIRGTTHGLSNICTFTDPTTHRWLATPNEPRMPVIRSEDDGLTWQNPCTCCLCWPISLRGVSFLNKNHAIACGSERIESDDGGQTWQSKCYFEGGIEAVAFSDELHGIIVGPFSNIFLTASGGAHWVRSNQFKKVPATECVAMLQVHFWSVTEGYASGSGFMSTSMHNQPDASGLLSTHDGGVSWSRTGSAPPVGFPKVLHFFSAGDIGLCGGSGGLYRTTSSGSLWMPLRSSDGGQSWSESITGDVQLEAIRLTFSNDQNGILLGIPLGQDKRQVYMSQNGGQSWLMRQLPASVQNCTLTDVSISGTSSLLVIGRDSTGNGFLLRSGDGGINWSTYQLSGSHWPTNLHRVTTSGQTDTFFVLDTYGNIYRSDNQVAWTLRGHLPSGPSYYDNIWFKLWFSDSSNGWAIGGGRDVMFENQRNLIYKTTDGGSNWIPDRVTKKVLLWLNDITGWSGKFVVVLGPNHIMLRRERT